jgi:hypothetical protein
MTGPSPTDSRVALALQKAIVDSSADAKLLIFLPWYDDDPAELEKVAGKLELPLITAKVGIADPASAAGLIEMIEAIGVVFSEFCNDKRISETVSALLGLPSTEALLRCAQDRILATIEPRAIDKLLLFCPRHFPDGAHWQVRAIALARSLNFERIVVAGATRPFLETRDVHIPWTDFSEDVARDALREPATALVRTAIERFISFLGSLDSRSRGVAQSGRPPTPDETLLSAGERWHSLVLRLCFPNPHLANKVISQWKRFEDATDELRAPGPEADKEILRDRARFLTLLKELWPDAYRAVHSDLDGADQMYRLHIALFGGAAHTSLLSGLLLPRWRSSLEEPLFREFLFDCFGASSGYRPLVQRFESRTQLSKHLQWHETIATRLANETFLPKRSSPLEPQGQKTPEAIRESFRLWVKAVDQDLMATGTVDRLEGFHSTVLEPIQALDEDMDSGEALEFAQMLMTALELFANIAGFDTESDTLSREVSRKLTQALARSQGAVRIEALLLQARMLAATGKSLEAAEMLRPLRRIAHDPLSRAAMDIEEAFIRERSGDYLGAMNRYQQVLFEAEQIAADELSARAVLGQLRCDIAASSLKSIDSKDPSRLSTKILALRAQAMVQIQTARAPELFLLSAEGVPSIFLSHRSESTALTKQINSRLPSLSPQRVVCWHDQKLKDWEDFSPVIHKELLKCDAMLLMLSPGFFESEWCLHELHFALGQHDLRGIPLFWFCCDPDQNHPSVSCSDALETWKNELFPRLTNPAHRTAHFKERVTRLTRTGVCISQGLVHFQASPPALDIETLDQLLLPVVQAVSYLYERRALSAS